MPAPYVMPNASGMDTNSIIQKLIEVERIPLKRLQEDNKRNEIRIQAWEELRVKTKKLSDISRDLYSFTGPFAEKKLFSSDEKSITGTVSPNIKEVNHKIQVLQLAKKHRIRSREINTNEEIPPGKFSILIGNKEIEFDFKGGNVNSLEKLLKEKSMNEYDVFLVNVDSNKNLIVLSSKIFGTKGKLEFKDPDKILQYIGIIGQKGKKQEVQQEIEFESKDVLPSDTLEITSKIIKIKEEVNHIVYLFPIQEKITKVSFTINHQIKENELPKNREKEKIYVGPEIKNKIENIELLAPNIEIEKIFDSSELYLEKKTVLGTIQINYEILGTPKTKIIPIEKNQNSYQFELKDFFVEEPITIQSIEIKKNFKENLEFSDLIIKKIEEKEIVFEPLHIIEEAQDAKLLVNGVPIERHTNQNITDIIQGVSLNLHNTTNQEVELKIEFDYQKILEKIREWVKSYNELMTFIKDNDKFDRDLNLQLLRSTNPNENIEDGFRKLEDSSGIFAGDPLVRRMVSILNLIVSSSYQTKTKSPIRSLADIGITTGKIGSSWQDIKKGLLILEEEKLQESLKNYPDSVKELFATDKNEDLIIDDGVAFKTNQELSDYIKASGGMISSRIDLLKEKIKDNKKIILNKELSLGRKEEILKQKFGRMESAIQNSKSMNKFLQNKFGIKDE